MSLSFEESLRLAAKQELTVKNIAIANVEVPAIANLNVDFENNEYVATPMTLDFSEEENSIAAYAGDMDNWILSEKYLYYPEYTDDIISKIDESKSISVDSRQVNLTQESNSQYIPFEMPRYYDGFDLMKTSLLIHFMNKDKFEDYANVINVYYTNNKIRFAWLVDKRATAVDGKLSFEIHAIGVNSKGDEYIWKTKPNDQMNVLSSLCGNGVIEPDETWITSFMTQVTEKVAEAQAAAQEARRAIDDVRVHADNAEAYAEEAKSVVANAEKKLEGTVESVINDQVRSALSDYYTKSEVDILFENFDISDQLDEVKQQISNLDGLAKFNVEYNGAKMTFYNGDSVMKEIEINSDPTQEWTDAYSAQVDEKISAVKTEMQEDILSVKDEIQESISDVNAVAIEAKNIATTAEAATKTNKDNVTTLGAKVAELEDAIAGIDQSPKLTYEATYDEEQIYTLWEIEGEGDNEVRTPKGQFKIQGGAAGGGTSSVLKIEYVTKTPMVVTLDGEAKITYIFSGIDSGGDAVLEGTTSWKVGGRTVATGIAVNGENTFDLTPYLALGTQKVVLTITDDAGSLVTKSWTVQKIDIRLESTFNDKLAYPMEVVAFDYTPYGAISKDVHFILDGTEIGKVTTSSSGIPMGYNIPAQTHGAHLLEVYIDAMINNQLVPSNHILKDIIWYDPNNKTPVISTIYQKFETRQYDTTNIVYTVYDPSTETPTVSIAVNGEVVSTPTLTESTAIYSFKPTEPGDYTITITCGNEIQTVKVLNAKVSKLDIEIEPVTAGLVFDFNPVGKNNNAADRTWTNGDIAMNTSDNFDWINGGYQLDDNGDQYFCIKAGTSADINYQLFADDAKRNGKEMKLIFKTTNVQTSDAVFMHCMDNTTGDNHIGIDMCVHEAHIYGQAGVLPLPYSENDIIEFEFNISKDTEAIKMVMGYEDGVSTRNMVYDNSFSFTQNTPQMIHLGSDYCDLHIYRMKVYNVSLTDRGILNNFIADARSAEDMISRYERNQIYDENSQLDPDVLAEKCPWLHVYKLSAPYFTNNKSDKVPGTTIEQIYKNGDPILDNWTCYDCMHSGQGTSSNNYGAAGRNLDFIMNKSGIEGVDPYFIMGDGSRATEITLSRTSVPVAYLNAKVNIASSNNLTNAILANRYNEFNPYRRPFVRGEGIDTSFIKDTMEFHNCVIFIQETNDDVSTHREFADKNWHFYAIGNIGDSKKTDETRLTDMSDKYECCVEIMDVELPLSDFPRDTMYNAMGYKEDETTKEKIYIWAKNENLGILYEKIGDEYVLTQDTEVDLNKTYYVDILEHDDFSEDFTYGWRYLYEDGTDEENAEVFNFCKQKWIEFYRFVTTSTNEEFKARLGEYFVIDSALYYYLFTTRYCMVDNRAKNSFWHYGKTGQVDAMGNPIRKWDLCWDYDNDTACGLNNYGAQVYRYGLEDTDVDEKGEEVFREADSTFFCRIRDLFPAELKAMYNTLESKNAWHAESFLNKCDAWQDEFPEELWRIDIERKYIRTYNSSFINGKGDSQFLTNMANGKMKYHRRQWERDQEAYMASKYQSSAASSDNAVLRCTVPTTDVVVAPNYRLKLTPFSYMYLNVKYGTQNPIQVKAEPNKEYEIPFDGNSADIIDIYSASRIKSLGDLSSCYAATVDTSKASKLTELNIGSDVPGYDNPSLTTLTLGANYLLKKLNVENVSGLTQALDLSALHNLRELYAKGSSTSGVTFADGGLIEVAELPAIGAMTAKNLAYMETLDIDAYDKLTTLIIENCSAIDLLDIFNAANNLNRVRITGIDWTLQNTDLLDRIYHMAGVDKDGYNADKAILAGKVHVPVIKQQKLREYREAWSDLEISYDTLIEQFPVTFKNWDGSILEVQYVDKGEDAVDPTMRTDNPLLPTKESSISHDFTFAGWSGGFTDIFNAREIIATYTESLRSYTIKYVSKGIVMQESVGLYGENIPYTGETPVYTDEEIGYVYYLFNRWDKSGIIDGDKTVNAVFDRFEYTGGSFVNKELKDMMPVEIYAMCQLGIAKDVLDNYDEFEFTIGNDIDYDDIESELIISEKTIFSGSNYLDTGIMLFDEDKDFVLAIDYEYQNSTPNSVLAQCYQGSGSVGFRLQYNNGVQLKWGSSTSNIASVNKREMVIIRHKKGDSNLTVYSSNLDGAEIMIHPLASKQFTSTATLVFGCEKQTSTIFTNYASGNINWAKIWYKDLGDDVCKDLVLWTHENIRLQVCGFNKYYLTDNPDGMCSFSLLASHLLDRNKKWNTANSNAGGWKDSELNASLNDRLYKAIPNQIRALIKCVKVPSSIGSKSNEIDTADCYITIPSCIEVDPTMDEEPYVNEGTTIPYMTKDDERKRAYDGGDYAKYWLRSPNVSNSNYVYNVGVDGKLYGFNYPYQEYGILIEISF